MGIYCTCVLYIQKFKIWNFILCCWWLLKLFKLSELFFFNFEIENILDGLHCTYTDTDTHTHTHHLVTARMQIVARKQPATIIQPQRPSGGVMTPDVLLSPSNLSSLVTAITPASHRADWHQYPFPLLQRTLEVTTPLLSVVLSSLNAQHVVIGWACFVKNATFSFSSCSVAVKITNRQKLGHECKHSIM